MTFEQFQATRKYVENLGAVINDARFDEEPTTKGNVYLGSLYIEEVGDHWPEDAKVQGKWYLLIERDEWITDDLERLEFTLYNWASDAGYFDNEKGAE